jgi:predicted DNA-binding protein|tara:strand:- start:409 stop:696 length:288 start_codon:yes stop_codon:yes gene_type:complete
MNLKDWAIPTITVVFAAGAAVAGFEATAEDTKELQERVVKLESKSGKQEVIDLKIEGVEKRLDKMEDLMGKMVEIQQQQAINQAKICSATNADCD